MRLSDAAKPATAATAVNRLPEAVRSGDANALSNSPPRERSQQTVVYAGRRRLGELFVLDRRKIEAVDIEGRSLGLFDDLKTAMAAVTAAAGSGGA